MKLKKIAVLLSLFICGLYFSCAPKSSPNIRAKCNENLKFKKEFFHHINNVSKQMTIEKNESFDESLQFIAKYTKVSFESMLNYNHTYPYGVFEEDKKQWLIWYENNKCKSLQFK